MKSKPDVSPIIAFVQALARRQARIDFGPGGDYENSELEIGVPLDYDAIVEEIIVKWKEAPK